MTRIAFIVNGSNSSAMGHRARALAGRLNKIDYDPVIAYRGTAKIAAIAEFSHVLNRMRPDLTYVLDMGYSGVVAGALHRLTRGGRLVIDTGDAIAALAVSMGRGPAGRLMTASLESFGLRTADLIVVRGTLHREWMAARGIEAILIPDGVETDLFAPRPQSDRRSHFGVGTALTIGMIGSSVWSPRLGICYGWDLVEAVGLLRDLPVRGVMIGEGTGIAHLKRRCNELRITDRVLFLGRVPYAELPAHLSTIDICLSTQTDDLPGRVRTTGKLPLYLAAGRYILASRVGEAPLVLPDEMLVEYNGVVDRAYPGRLAERVRALVNDRKRLLAGLDGVATARRLFDYDVLAKRVSNVASALIDAPAAAVARQLQ